VRRRSDPFVRPLDRALLCLRVHELPYRADERHTSTWAAVCPSCRVPAWTLTLREHGYGGSIDLRCIAGCESADIAAALEADPVAWLIEAAEAREAEAWRIVGELRELAARALELAHEASVEYSASQQLLSPRRAAA
jgi:hypothetical protein